MIMIVHETIRMEEPVVLLDHRVEDSEKDVPVLIGAEDFRTAIPPGADMVESAGVFKAERTRHEGSVAPKR
jgi:hypothetical protein